MAKIDDPDSKVTRIQLCGVQGCCPTVEIHHGSDKIVIIFKLLLNYGLFHHY